MNITVLPHAGQDASETMPAGGIERLREFGLDLERSLIDLLLDKAAEVPDGEPVAVVWPVALETLTDGSPYLTLSGKCPLCGLVHHYSTRMGKHRARCSASLPPFNDGRPVPQIWVKPILDAPPANLVAWYGRSEQRGDLLHHLARAFDERPATYGQKMHDLKGAQVAARRHKLRPGEFKEAVRALEQTQVFDKRARAFAHANRLDLRAARRSVIASYIRTRTKPKETYVRMRVRYRRAIASVHRLLANGDAL